MTIVGYTDRLSAAPGEEIRFMVSCDRPRYDVRLVQLIHGDTNPDGPGFKQRLVPSAIDGSRPGKRESIRSGSYFEAGARRRPPFAGADVSALSSRRPTRWPACRR